MAGANPLVCDRNGNTALHLSAHMGYPEAMKCLLERKSHLVTAPITVPSDMLIMNINGEKYYRTDVTFEGETSMKIFNTSFSFLLT